MTVYILYNVHIFQQSSYYIVYCEKAAALISALLFNGAIKINYLNQKTA